jgi:hypothetical protein
MIMKKDLIFTPLMLVDVVLLFLLKVTGLPAHIAVSVAGIAILIAYTVLTKKEWKIPALEIIMRACYGIALISGIVVMNVEGNAAVAVVHKGSAVLFAVLLIVLFVQKLLKKRA